MLKAVEHVMEEKWVKMYIERWLQMPIQLKDGSIKAKEGKGTPQGGVISPLLGNLYLHFTLDMWLSKHYPKVSFVRYADDVVLHCNTKAEAAEVLEAVKGRLAEVKLQIKEEKTRIAYCKDYRRREKHKHVQFEFLGFSYQPRARKSKVDGKLFMGFAPEISRSNQKRIREVIRRDSIWINTRIGPEEIGNHFNDKLRGWVNYYGKYSKRCLRGTIQSIDRRLLKWIRKKYKFGTRKAVARLEGIKRENPSLFFHWQLGY